MNELAKAVSYWLSYKAATGAAQLLTEGSLSIPIAESLFFQRWDIETQTDYHDFFPSISRGKIFVDFYARRDAERLALETKFFPKTPRSLVFNDILRLGMADPSSVQRVLLLAWSKTAKENSSAKEFNALLRPKIETAFAIDPVQCVLECEGRSFDLKYNKSEFDRLRKLRKPEAVSKIKVTCADITETETYGAAEYSIAPI
jgi:hypothetical protein